MKPAKFMRHLKRQKKMDKKQETIEMLEILLEQIDWTQSKRMTTVLDKISPDSLRFVLEEAIKVIQEE